MKPFRRNLLLVVLTGTLSFAQNAVPSYLQVRNVSHGTVQSVSYKSKALGTDRKMVVYTPPGYEQVRERYSVLYLLHGAGSDETSWTQRGSAHAHPG
jgi:enterochelin esterase-like enzyme